jgi:hypothetical protein
LASGVMRSPWELVSGCCRIQIKKGFSKSAVAEFKLKRVFLNLHTTNFLFRVVLQRSQATALMNPLCYSTQ